MKFTTEETSNNDKALIVTRRAYKLVQKLGRHLAAYDIDVDVESEYPEDLSEYAHLYVFAESANKKHLLYLASQETSIILIVPNRRIFHNAQDIIRQEDIGHTKVILAHYDDEEQDTVDNIVWFSLSETDERFLNSEKDRMPDTPDKTFKKKNVFKWTKRKVATLILVLTLVLETFFIIPSLGSMYYIYRAGRSLQDQDAQQSQEHIEKAEPLLNAAQQTYKPARPLLSLMFLALPADRYLSLQEDAFVFIKTASQTLEQSQELINNVLESRITPEKTTESADLITTLQKNTAELENRAAQMRDKLSISIKPFDELQQNMTETSEYLKTINTIMPHAPQLLGADGPQKYVVFFMNNMELRPGGGFIGSFAFVTFDRYTMKEFTVLDVYDADGQLKAHVDPPQPIREHLNQPNWFLRDSNFSPDFEQNVETAEYFLEEELGVTGFDGAIGITTTAMTYMLEAFGDVYLSDYNETITADNFYIKAQAQSELDFVPGVSKKKSYLSTVGRTLMLQAGQADKALLGIALERALNEKHIVMLFDDPAVQQTINTSGWGGKLVRPQCVVDVEQCIVHPILPVQANLGVNKANHFTETFMNLSATVTPEGDIKHTLSTTFKNNSLENTFPGGTYKNYHQTFIPEDAVVESVDIDGNPVVDFDTIQTRALQSVGTLITVPPGLSKSINIDYTLENAVKTGTNIYQIIVQKQIGAFNKDFSFNIDLPVNIHATDTNFSDLAKTNELSYNSILSTDKVFIIELVKE